MLCFRLVLSKSFSTPTLHQRVSKSFRFKPDFLQVPKNSQLLFIGTKGFVSFITKKTHQITQTRQKDSYESDESYDSRIFKGSNCIDCPVIIVTLQGTNISPKNRILKIIFLFPRWDMLIPWRVLPNTSCHCKSCPFDK